MYSKQQDRQEIAVLVPVTRFLEDVRPIVGSRTCAFIGQAYQCLVCELTAATTTTTTSAAC